MQNTLSDWPLRLFRHLDCNFLTEEQSDWMSNAMTFCLKLLILHHIISLNAIKCQWRQLHNLKLPLIILCNWMTEQIIVQLWETCMHVQSHTKHSHLNWHCVKWFAHTEKLYHAQSEILPRACTLTCTHIPMGAIMRLSDLVYWSPAVSYRGSLERHGIT